MVEPRFVDSEILTEDGSVEKVWDTLYQCPRVRRRLWNLPRSEWEEARERFRDLAQISRSALPRLVAVGEEERTLTLVEDYVEGEPLSARLARDQLLTIPELVKLFTPIVYSLGSMHELFMGHGGINAQAIVIDEDDRGWLVGAGAREALPDMDFEALAEVMVRAIQTPNEESSALVHDLRSGKLRDCSKLVERLRDLVSEDDFESEGAMDEIFGEAPLEADVEDLSESEDDFDFGWPTGDELDLQRRADDRKMLQWFAAGTGAIATIGLIAAMGVEERPSEVVALTPEGPVEFALADEPPTEAPPRVEGLGKWRVHREDGTRHPTMVATIEAENVIYDRLERAGRPELRILCSEERLAVEVAPGVDTVEAFVAEDATYAKHADLAFTWEGFPTQHLDADFRPDAPDLTVRGPRALLAEAPRSESLYVAYTPFASESVMAIFDVRGMERALGALARFCPDP